MGVGAALIMPATLSILTNVFTDARERAIAIGLWSGVAGVGGRARSGRRRVPARALLVGLGVHRQRADRDRARSSPAASSCPTSRNPDAPPHRLDRRARSRSSGWSRWSGRSSRRRARAGPARRSLAGVRGRRGRAGRVRVRGSGASTSRCSTCASSATRASPRRASPSRCVFFALFGFIFLATQYLQFVLGYSPFEAGVRTLPFAVAMMVARAVVVEARSSGSARSASSSPGCCCSPPGLVGRVDVDGRQRLRPRSAIAMVLMGSGHGPRGRAGDRVDHGLAPAATRPASAPRSTTPAARSAARSASPSSAASGRRSTPAASSPDRRPAARRRSSTRCRRRRSSSRSSPRSAR